MVLLSEFSALSNILRLIFLLIVFIALLFGAHFFTKWYGRSGLIHARTANIEILESQQLSPGKNIVIAKIGSKYVSFIVFKEHAAVLTELNEDELIFEERKEPEMVSFKDIFQKVSKKQEQVSLKDWLKGIFKKKG
ncbi:MAG: flagellar biosynthetic protein FliO [Lachnospiraceae bacterium]|nr:flagellar biosynthetic protein FliO [Lachnospiraceae bacterium]